jgi:MFS family permease
VTYLEELRANWRYLVASGIGMSSGYAINNFISNIFTPHLIAEFGWTKSDIALIGGAVLLSAIGQPIAGRVADILGMRRMAMAGIFATPFAYVGLSLMTGNLWVYFFLVGFQTFLVSGLTSIVVYSRLVVRQLNLARGISLSIVACSAPAVAAVTTPFLSGYIDAHGWRTAYALVALCTAIGGAAGMLLMPKTPDDRISREVRGQSSTSYGAIVRNPAFLLIVGAFFLGNFSFTMQLTQLKVILLDKGIDTVTGSWAIALFAFGVVMGRFFCGFALDRFPAYAVAAIALGAPAIGLTILASDISTPTIIGAAVLSLGLCMGSEVDVSAYIITKYFRRDIYSTILGIVGGMIALAAAAGSFLLSFLLHLSGTFTSFLILCAVSSLAASVMFILLARLPMMPTGNTHEEKT